MEAINNKYHNGKIYTIRSPYTDKYYIGSTCQPLHKRLYEHRRAFEYFSKNNKKYITSIEVVKYDDHYIELLEDCKSETKYELNKREGELIRKHKKDIVNICIPCRTSKEYDEDNKEKISKYCEDNKEKRKEYQRIYKETHPDILKNYYERLCKSSINNIPKEEPVEDLEAEFQRLFY